jgi:hypothetical protein
MSRIPAAVFSRPAPGRSHRESPFPLEGGKGWDWGWRGASASRKSVGKPRLEPFRRVCTPIPDPSPLNRGKGQSTRNAYAIALTLALLAGCGRAGADWRVGKANQAADAPSAGYVRPPQLGGAARAADGGTVLSGQGEADVRLRLASPDGGAYGATADDAGRWTLTLPASTDVRLFGLSEETGGRVIQGEGYIAVLPAPGRPAALLRAGGGAAPLADSPDLQITAVDFDAAGGGVVSGTDRPGAALRATIDGAAAGETHASQHGHFAMALTSALKSGVRQVEVQSGAASVQASVAVSPPPPAITGLPYRGERVDGGWRIDWLTPGGGPQSTLVLDPAGTAP